MKTSISTDRRALMKQFLLLILLPGVLAAQDARRTLAVLDFSNNSIADKQGVEALRKGFADIFTTELSRIPAFQVVEREKIRNVITELEFQQSEYVDPATAQKVGKLLGAEFLVLGGYVHSFGGTIRVDLRIVEVETGRTIRGEEETDDLDDLFDLVEDLTKKLSRFFKAGLPNDFERPGARSKEAALFYARAVGFEDAGKDLIAHGKEQEARTAFESATRLLRQAIATSPDFTAAQEKLQRIERTLKTLR